MERPPGAVEDAGGPPRHEGFDPPAGAGPGRTSPKRRGFGGRAKPPARPDGEGSGSYDVRNSWQVLAGSILIPLGLVLILIAWYGAAHARVVQQQIPYMVSGSFIGLGCMVVGGLLYWGHWLYRIYDQSELHHEEQQHLMRELIAAVSGNSLSTSGARGAGATGASTYLATASGSVYHQAGCPVIAHNSSDLRVLEASAVSGMRPCQICTPA